MATLDMTNTKIIDPLSLNAGDIINCPYTGERRHVVLLPGQYKLECWGAQGGSYNEANATGGLGAYAKGLLTLTKPTILYLYAGGKGSYGTSTATSTKNGGGFNGGGNASYRGGAGGGASDIRINDASLYARVIVAGGGGGAYSYDATYKANGGNSSQNGSNGGYYNYTTFYGYGGTQTAGGASNTGVSSGAYNGEAGSFGRGGSSGQATSTSYYSNGAGGGGWYGGSGADCYSSNSWTRASGGGGGSSYVFNINTASNYPSGCLLNYSYYLTESYVNDGTSTFVDYSGSTVTGHSGNGAIRITIQQVNPIIDKIYLKINSNTWKLLFENKIPEPAMIPTVSVTNGASYSAYVIIDGTKYTNSVSNLKISNPIIIIYTSGDYWGTTGDVTLNGTIIHQTEPGTTEEYSWDSTGYSNVQIDLVRNVAGSISANITAT